MKDSYNDNKMLDELDKVFGTVSIKNMNTDPLDLSVFDNTTMEALESKRIKAVRENEADPLIDSLKESTHINDITRETLIRLAKLYMQDMKSNILKDQFDLEEKYDETTADEWATFLSDRVVSTYIAKHKNALLKAKAESNLADPYAKNKRDNIALLNRLDEKDTEDKQQIIIIRLPDKYGDDDEEIS